MTEARPKHTAPARATARKCADISDRLFLRAVAETKPSYSPRPGLEHPRGPGALDAAYRIREAVQNGGWPPRTPTRSPYAVYTTLLKSMDVPVRIFLAKARILDERRHALTTYEGRWHLPSECLEDGCCDFKAIGKPGAPEPVTRQELEFMGDVLSHETELRAQYEAPAVAGSHRDPVLLATAGHDPAPPAAALMPAWDAQTAIRELLGKVLARPSTTPFVEDARRRILEGAEIPVDTDGWVTGRRPTSTAAARTGCRFEYGTWIHYPPHSCPAYVREPTLRRPR